jgi:hypothetical protein
VLTPLPTADATGKGSGDQLPQACNLPNTESIAFTSSASRRRLGSTPRSGVAVRLAASLAACFSGYLLYASSGNQGFDERVDLVDLDVQRIAGVLVQHGGNVFIELSVLPMRAMTVTLMTGRMSRSRCR